MTDEMKKLIEKAAAALKDAGARGKAGDILQHPFDLIDLDEVNPFTRYLKEEKELQRIG